MAERSRKIQIIFFVTPEEKEYIVPVRENTHKKEEINLDDALLE